MDLNAVVVGSGRLGMEVYRHLRAKGYSVKAASHEMIEVTDSYSVMKFFDRTAQIDVLVYAVGSWGHVDKISRSHPDLWRKAIDINLVGMQACCYYGMKKMRSGGHIIAFAGGGKGPAVMRSGLACAKTAIARFVETLAAEEPQFHVNAIAPGPMYSKMHEAITKFETSWAEEFRKMRDTGSGEIPPAWSMRVIDMLLDMKPSGNLYFARDFYPRQEVAIGSR